MHLKDGMHTGVVLYISLGARMIAADPICRCLQSQKVSSSVMMVSGAERVCHMWNLVQKVLL